MQNQSLYSGCKLPGEESTRAKALAWWNNIPEGFGEGSKFQKLNSFLKEKKRIRFCIDPEQIVKSLTGREIEEIYSHEILGIQNPTAQVVADVMETTSKHVRIPKVVRDRTLGEKQFEKFDENQFKDYISKFSRDDKFRACKILWDELNITEELSVVLKSK
jgi:hypothetical protein